MFHEAKLKICRKSYREKDHERTEVGRSSKERVFIINLLFEALAHQTCSDALWSLLNHDPLGDYQSLFSAAGHAEASTSSYTSSFFMA